jgi:hypothetical protein
MRKLTLLLAYTLLFAGTVCAQIPETPAGRQFAAWLKAQGSGDRDTIQQFIDKNMPWGRVEQELAMRNQSGGYEIKKVEESSETHLVVLAQQRGSGRQFVRISMNVAAAEPHQIASIRIQPAQPPPELAPPKMAEAEVAAARTGAPFHQFSAWLEVFNTGDRDRIRQYLEANFPSANLDGQMNFRQRTGGLELRALEQATATTLTGLVQERNSDQFGRFTLVVESTEPYRITRLPVSATPRPAEIPYAAYERSGGDRGVARQSREGCRRGHFRGNRACCQGRQGSVQWSLRLGGS